MTTNPNRPPPVLTMRVTLQQWQASASTRRGPGSPRIIPRVHQYPDPLTNKVHWWTAEVFPRLYQARQARAMLAQADAPVRSVSLGPIVRVRVAQTRLVQFAFLRAAEAVTNE